jgi:hypothetical protein
MLVGQEKIVTYGIIIAMIEPHEALDLAPLILGLEYNTSAMGLMRVLDEISRHTHGGVFISQEGVPQDSWENFLPNLEAQGYIVVPSGELKLGSVDPTRGRNVIVTGYSYDDRDPENEKRVQALILGMGKIAKSIFVFSQGMVPRETFDPELFLERAPFQSNECWSLSIDPQTDVLSVVRNRLVDKYSLPLLTKQEISVQEHDWNGIKIYSYVLESYPVPKPES